MNQSNLRAKDGGRRDAKQPTLQQTHQLSQSEAWEAAIAFVSDQERLPRTSERIPRTSERTPRTAERIRQRIHERRINFRKNLIWERTPMRMAESTPESSTEGSEERFMSDDDEDDDMEWMDPTGNFSNFSCMFSKSQ